MPTHNIRPNVTTTFTPTVSSPAIDSTAFVHPLASIIGLVSLGRRVMVSPFASLRGDEGTPLYIGDETNIQDSCVIHALETSEHGEEITGNLYEVNGKKYAVYIGARCSLAHQSQVHGPAVVEDDVFVGMQALVFRARIGEGCVIEPAAKVVGVTIPPRRIVPLGAIVTQQADADSLTEITDDYPFRNLNSEVVQVNIQLAEGYKRED